MPNIAIIWDFDKTLTPQDSTTEVVKYLEGTEQTEFWDEIHALRGDKKQKDEDWIHILASDAPIWMYSLSRLAFLLNAPLNSEFFEKFIAKRVALYPNAEKALKKIKDLSSTKPYKDLNLEIHHFIVSAGLQELIKAIMPKDIITSTFGCRYAIRVDKDNPNIYESIPVYCIDETMKTRSIFEISKGSFNDPEKSVNARVANDQRFVPFENMIYIGDSDTDVPSLALVKEKGGLGIIVYDPKMSKQDSLQKHKKLRENKRADLITPADFSLDGELFKYISARCKQICQRYEAEKLS